MVDPDGEAPVYDKEGNLIGTDENGLKGNAFVMEKDRFVQGMPANDAKKLNLGLKGLNDKDAEKKLYGSLHNLKKRPDYDGVVTDEEAREWYNNGNGETLYIDASKIDLSPLTTDDFKAENDNKLRFNFFISPRSSKTTGRVYGTLSMRLKNRKTGEVGFFTDKDGNFDIYDFKMDNRPIRNCATFIAKQIVGDGVDFKFKLYGKNPKVPTK